MAQKILSRQWRIARLKLLRWINKYPFLKSILENSGKCTEKLSDILATEQLCKHIHENIGPLHKSIKILRSNSKITAIGIKCDECKRFYLIYKQSWK